MKTGICFWGSITKTLIWEIQLFALTRAFSDGITWFEFTVNWDRWKSEHTPAFQIELTILNCHNHLWINKTDYTSI